MTDATAPTLIVGPAWVGDMVMAHSLVQALKAQTPDTRIDILAPPATAPIARLMPDVGKVIEIGVRRGRLGARARWQVGRALSQTRYGLAIVLPRSWKSALVPALARIPGRRGYRGELRYGLLTDIRPDVAHRDGRTVDKFVALSVPVGGEAMPAPDPVLSVDPAAANVTLDTFGLDPGASHVALCPGAEFGPSKQWPIASFAALAARLVQEGHRPVVLGTGQDRDAGATIAKAAPDTIDLTGRTRLEEAGHILSVASAVVTNDSGLMHVAAALGRPVLALFGSTSAKITPPLGARAAVINRELPCRPCFERTCPLGHHDCLRSIMPDEVATRLSDLMAAKVAMADTPGSREAS
ncbi:MAG: lipopolysaccharide heptosyltransferase II [Pseudomonadota bacterium]